MTELEAWVTEFATLPRPAIAKILLDAGEMTFDRLNALLAESTQYWPVGGQKKLHAAAGARIKIGAGGWRSGKSRWMARELSFPLVTQPNAFGWIVGSDYELARHEFKYVMLDIRALGYPTIVDLSTPQQGRWRMTLSNGSVLETMTGEDINKIEGANLDVAALAEASSISRDLQVALEGRLTEKRGTLLASGRFRGSFNWYAELFRQGQATNDIGVVSASFRTWDNRYYFFPCDPEQCQKTTTWKGEGHGRFHDPEIQRHYAKLSEDEFGEMFAAEPRPDRSLVFANEWDRATHMVEMTFEDTLKEPIPVKDAGGKIVGFRLPKKADVEVWVDPGYAGAYAVLARQSHAGTVYVIDELYVQGMIGEEVIERVKAQWWYPYTKSGVGDIAIKQHPATASQQEVWRKQTNLWLRCQVVLIHEGIERLRTFLKDPMTKRPRIYFSPKCVMTAWEFEAGYRYHPAVERRPTKEDPVDADNHAVKAVVYGIVDNFGRAEGMFQDRAITREY